MSSGTSVSAKWEKRNPTDLRVVLIGGRHGGRSSVGNTILGKDVFDTKSRTVKSVVKQELVSGRTVTVVNTPGWKSPYPLDLTPKQTRLNIQQSVYMCAPGPHAFVLVMPLDTTNEGTWMSVEEHMSLLGDRVWRHTIVVFTVAGEDKMRPVRDLIKSDYDIRCLTKQCEDRFHVLNISDRADGSQVTELLDKIEEMVSNGCHYETEKHTPEELKEMEKTIRRRAEQRRADAHKQTTGIPKGIGMTDLRILLMGSCRSGKSSTGNTILGGRVFKTDQRSAHCEVRQGKVAGRHLTVVDSPGWFYNSQLKDLSEMDKLEIQNSVYLCPAGPHAVLILVPVHQAFTKAQRVAVEQHMALLTQGVWSHTIVVFTCGDWLGDGSIEQHIEAEGEDLRWLVDKCGNRFHVFNNKKKEDTQVTGLLKKIEDMVAVNRGGHYEVGEDVSEKLSERKSNIEEHVKTFMTNTRKQRTALKALFEGEHQGLPDVRLMLVGGEQSGRSAAGNYILQKTMFIEPTHKEFNPQTKQIAECVIRQRRFSERNVSVVNCPDWPTTPPSQKIKDDLLHGHTLCSPGPHAVLLTVSVRSCFSEADRKSVQEHIELLGDRVWRHILVLFTWGWWLGGRHVEEYIESEGDPLRWLLEKCGYRYHVMQFSDWNISEVKELMEKIEDMVMRNRGHFGRLDSREESYLLTGNQQIKKRSFRDTGHFLVGQHDTSQKTLLERLKQKRLFTAEQWNKREEGWKETEEAFKRRDEEWRRRDEEWMKREEEWRRREEEWRRREEELITRMLKFVVTESEEPTLPALRRRNSMEHLPPSLSGGTPSEAGRFYCRSPAKVSDWLLNQPGPIAPSSGYDTVSESNWLLWTDSSEYVSTSEAFRQTVHKRSGSWYSI